MGLRVEVQINGETVAEGTAVNTGTVYGGKHVYDYRVSNGGDVSRSGKLHHDREEGAAALASKLMGRVAESR